MKVVEWKKWDKRIFQSNNKNIRVFSFNEHETKKNPLIVITEKYLMMMCVIELSYNLCTYACSNTMVFTYITILYYD